MPELLGLTRAITPLRMRGMTAMLGRIKRKVAASGRSRRRSPDPQRPDSPTNMARKQASQGTPATAALAAAGVPFVAHPYTHDPAAASYGLEAAEVLGVDPARVFKTLMVDVDGRLAVGVVPVSGSLDLKAMAAALGGKKAAMADPAAARAADRLRARRHLTAGPAPVLPHGGG